MRIGGEWIASKEDFPEGDEPDWLGIGYATAEGGGLLLLIAIIVTGIGVRRLRRQEAETSALVRVGGVLATLVLIAYVVAVWAMSGKPG
jgi:hypothetical protein